MSSPSGTVSVTAKPLISQARAHFQQDQFEAAAKSLIAHLRQRPGDPEALSILGQTALMLGALGQAERFLRQAMAAGANGIDERRALVSVVNQQERLGEALALIEGFDGYDTDVDLRAIRGGILNKLGRSDEAMAIYARLAEENPGRPQMWIAHGHDLRAAGRVDEAISAYRRALAADSEFGDAWWGLASIKRPVLTDEDIEKMQQMRALAVDVRNSAPIEFSLARAFHDRERFREAFEHYSEGNRLRAESLNYDRGELTREVAESERLATPEFMAALDREPLGEDRPVFIVSLPRSGSTLLEQMLGSHPAIEPIGELPYVPAILRTAMELATRHGRPTVPQLVAGLSDDQAATMGQDYLRRVSYHRKTDRPAFIDKLPHNWSNILFIRRILPQARFIDIRRPAMDCCFSNFTQSFTSAHAASFALEDIGQCYVDNVRMMNHLKQVAPGLVHHTDYERLVDFPQDEISRVLEYLDLPWDDAVLGFHQLDRVVRTPSSEQVRRPLNRDGIDVWKPYAAWLGPLRNVLGDLARQSARE